MSWDLNVGSILVFALNNGGCTNECQPKWPKIICWSFQLTGMFTKENFKHLCKPGHYKEALYPVTCRSIDLNFTDRGSISMSWVNECATLNTSCNIYCHFCFSTNGSWGLGELKLPYLTSVCLPTKSMFAIWFNPVLSFWANSIVLFSLQFHEMLNLFT